MNLWAIYDSKNKEFLQKKATYNSGGLRVYTSAGRAKAALKRIISVRISSKEFLIPGCKLSYKEQDLLTIVKLGIIEETNE